MQRISSLQRIFNPADKAPSSSPDNSALQVPPAMQRITSLQRIFNPADKAPPPHKSSSQGSETLPTDQMKHSSSMGAIFGARSLRPQTPATGSRPIPSGVVGVVALDFDGTLAIRGVAYHDLQHGIVDFCFGGAERVAALTVWLTSLKEGGALLAIVSRNSHRIVHTCVTHLSWLHLFGDRIYGREEIERHSMLHGRKSVLIRKLLTDPFGLRAEDVMFVDDDEENCEDCGKRLGTAVLFVRGKAGMVGTEMDDVTEWLQGRVADAKTHGEAYGARHSTASVAPETFAPTGLMQRNFTSPGLSSLA
ncbi:hypothetical protein T492DRAFT_945358 [Pavlovales sp. CCMP2436]|nr:hypothetical protein T492DRAFT_945358 [Pavlovales sp. CCMP2436]